jgi:hypothetical protein
MNKHGASQTPSEGPLVADSPLSFRLFAFGLWPLFFGFWSLAFGLWLLVFGFWSLAFGLWLLALALAFGPLAPWSLAAAITSRGGVPAF